MKKISKLTIAQTKKMAEYVKIWTEKGLTTNQKSHYDAVRDFTAFQKHVLKMENPAPVVLLNSPNECWMAIMIASTLSDCDVNQVESQVRSQVESQVKNQIWSQVANQVESQVANQVESQVRSQVWSQVQSQVANQVANQVWSQVGSQVRSQVRSQVESQVWSQVQSQVANQVGSQVANQVRSQFESQVTNQIWSQVANQVGSQVGSQVESQVVNQVWSQKITYPYFDCQYWAGWFSYYEFARNELAISFTNSIEYESFLNCHSYGMVWPLKNLCVVCQPPTVINKNSRGLHCENGPALSYNGQNEIYALNGVTMPKEIVLTSSEDLSIDFFKNEKNADVKAEFVRKFGIERMLDMGKLLDTFENYPNQKDYDWWWKSQYELYDMSKCFADILYQPYLKMMNQTTKIWHMEAVSPSCRTLKDAIKERFGGKEMKIVAIA
jgi:hypothetical protein